MHITIPNETDVTISGNDLSPVEILAQLKVEIADVVDNEINKRVEQSVRGEPLITFEVLGGSQPSVQIVVRANGLYEIRKYNAHVELPPETAPDLDAMATLVVRFFKGSEA